MAEFLVTHGILDGPDRRPRARFCWCSDGPWDICDFVIKQCFISKVNWTLIEPTPSPIFLEDGSSAMDLKPVHRCPCPTGQGETRKYTPVFLLICLAHRLQSVQ